jgi:hypothetical protein
MENLDAIECGVVGVFIAPTTKIWPLEGCCRMAHQTVRCATRHRPVRQPRQQTVGVRPLELWLVGPLGCPVVHRTGLVDCPMRQLRVLCPMRAQARIKCVTVDRCARSSRCSAGTPDSPVLHRTVRWIIAERPSIFPKVRSSAVSALVHGHCPVAHRTVRCARLGCLLGCLFLSLFEPFLGLFIGLLWIFGTCRTYRLELTS